MPEIGGFHDPNVPEDGVQIEPYRAGGPTSRVWWNPFTWKTEGWILEKRLFNRYYRAEVPTRARDAVETVATGPTREARAGGKCWTECEYVTLTRRVRYYVVSR